jgi:phage gpG-like protein
VPAKVEDRDLGWKKIKRELEWLSGKSVTIGWQGKSVLTVPGLSGEATIVDIATFHEFGTVNIPARPMLRTTNDKHQNAIADFFTKQLGDVVEGKRKGEQALSRSGMLVASKIQQTIRESPSWAEPLAPSTIAAKGSTKPLIDTGRMIQSVTWAIRSNGSITKEGGASGESNQ